MRQRYQAPISLIDNDAIPERVRKICDETDAAWRFSAMAHLPGLPGEAPGQGFQQAQTVLFEHDQAGRALDCLRGTLVTEETSTPKCSTISSAVREIAYSRDKSSLRSSLILANYHKNKLGTIGRFWAVLGRIFFTVRRRPSCR